MKKYKIMFWVSTGVICFTQGIVEIFMLQSSEAISGITHLGYPVYFFTMLVVLKVLGSLALILPMVPPRIKEWAYAGFGIDFISAFVSNVVVDGFTGEAIPPVIALIVLYISYVSYYKTKTS